MTDEDFIWTKKITDEYRSIRQYMFKDFYNHGSEIFDETSWTIWQYHDPDKNSGIVIAFRRSKSPFDSAEIRLKGVNKGVEYIFTELDTKSVYVKNAEIKIVLPEKRSSTVIQYKVKD